MICEPLYEYQLEGRRLAQIALPLPRGDQSFLPRTVGPGRTCFAWLRVGASSAPSVHVLAASTAFAADGLGWCTAPQCTAQGLYRSARRDRCRDADHGEFFTPVHSVCGAPAPVEPVLVRVGPFPGTSCAARPGRAGSPGAAHRENRRESRDPVCSRHPDFRKFGSCSFSPCDLCGDSGKGVEIGSPLLAEPASPMHVTSVPPVVVEYVQSDPVVEFAFPAPAVSFCGSCSCEYVAPALAVTCATPAPVDAFAAPAPAVAHAAPAQVVELVNPAPAATYAAPAPVVDCLTPAPIEAYDAPADVDEGIVPAPAVTYAASAPVDEDVAPASVDEFDAPAPAATCAATALVDVGAGSRHRARGADASRHSRCYAHWILNDFHQCVQRIPHPLPHPPTLQPCAAPSQPASKRHKRWYGRCTRCPAPYAAYAATAATASCSCCSPCM